MGSIRTSLSSILLVAIGLAACQRKPSDGRLEAAAANGSVVGAESGVAAFIDLPAVVRDVVRVPAHRRLRVLEDAVIGVGGRLELGPGVTVAVATGKGLYVKGGELFARGTAKERIVFTSLAANPQPGDWCGVVFDWDELLKQSGAKAWPASTLEHVAIEFAGRPWEGVGWDQKAGGLSILGYSGVQKYGSPASLVLSDIEFRNNARRGMDVRTDAPLSWKDIKFGPNGGVSALIDINRVNHLGGAPTESVELFGIVRRTMELPPTSTAYVVVDSLRVGSLDWDTPAVLTIPPGTTLKFKAEQGLAVGDHYPGRLVARGVTFTSAEAEPKAGDWGGIRFGELGSADLDGDTFEYAGARPRYVLVWSRRSAPHVDIQRSTFRKNAAPALWDPFSCARWKKDARGNVSEGQPLCNPKK